MDDLITMDGVKLYMPSIVAENPYGDSGMTLPLLTQQTEISISHVTHAKLSVIPSIAGRCALKNLKSAFLLATKK